MSGQLWSGTAERVNRARAAEARNGGDRKCAARRAIEALLPGDAYVLASKRSHGDAAGMVARCSARGKRFTTRMLPCGRIMVVRVT